MPLTENYADTIDRVADGYPEAVAVMLERYEDEIADQRYAAALPMFIDIFELTVQFTCSYLLRRLFAPGRPAPAALREPLEALSSRKLTTGLWFEIFRRLIRYGHQQGEPLARAFVQRYRGSFRTSFDRIPHFRTSAVAHDSAQKNESARQMLESHQACLFEFLEASAPLSDLDVPG